MRKKVIVTSIMLLVLMVATILVGCTGGKALPGHPDDLKKALKEGGYEVVFEDNFDGDEINWDIWQGYGSNVRRGAYYSSSKENLFVSNGNLTIRTFYQNTGAEVGWHTGWLESPTNQVQGKGFSAQYGYFEARCVAPPCEGIWSAFWLMPDGEVKPPWDGSTAEFGTEIDIMESFSYNKNSNDGIAQMVLHLDYSGKGIAKVTSDQYKIKNMYSEFHTYGIMWTPTDYTWFVDGRKVLQTKHIWKGKDYGTPKVPQYPVLSVEVGGKTDENGKPIAVNDWAGNPNSNDKNKNYDFIIDYVKIYQIAK